MSIQTGIRPMHPTRKAILRSGIRHFQRGRAPFASFGLAGRLVGVAVGLLVLVVPPAWATHVEGDYLGTDEIGDAVRFIVRVVEGAGMSVNQFYAVGSGKGKTDLGQDCTPVFPPPADALPIVDHAFSDAAPPFTVSGSFSEPQSASGTFRAITDTWWPPPGELPRGSTCDTGTVSWTASCANAPLPCSTSPTFSGSASRAKVATTGKVAFSLRIGCPPPGVDCRVSVAATARVPVGAAAGRRRAKLGRSDYLVKVGSSAKGHFVLSTKGRRLLRRLRRIKAKAEITVTRGSQITEKIVRVRLKAPMPTR